MATRAHILPKELWVKIARRLALKECIRLSSTCRSLRGVMTPFVSMSGLGNSEAEMRWLVKNWGSASRLYLSFDAFPESWAPPPEAANLAGLQSLVVLKRGKGGSEERFGEWLAGVLRYCSALKSLNTRDILPASWPALAALRHLEVTFHEPQLDGLLSSLLGMHGLRTLRLDLCCSADPQSSSTALDLSALRHLRCLSLQDLRPAQLALPDGCTLTYSASWYAAAQPVLLDASLRNMVAAASFETYETSHLEVSTLEGLGSRCECLHSLGGSIGSKLEPMTFPANVMSLTVLHLNGDLFNIVLPRAMQLRDLYIEAAERLEVSTEDPAALSRSLVWCNMLYSQLTGTDVILLFVLLHAAGKHVVPMIMQTHDVVRGMRIVPPVAGMARKSCACGACTLCLHGRNCGCESQCLF